MIEWFSGVRQLLMKELKLELRGKELFTLLACNALLMSALVGAGVSSSMVDQTVVHKIFPSLLWLVFLFTTTASVNRGNEHELEGRAFEGLLLSGFTASQMYVAKVIVTWLYLAGAFAMTAGGLAVTLNQQISTVILPLLLFGAASSLGVAALMVILVVVASTSRMKGVLLPLISLPLLFPLFFAGTEMTAELLARGALDMGSIWVSIILIVDVVYFVAGINLFEFVLKD